jgi:hypothetical protein
MGASGRRHAPAALPPGKRPGTHCLGEWVVQGRSGKFWKNSPSPVLDPQTVQPIATRYFDYAIPDHILRYNQVQLWENVWCLTWTGKESVHKL